MITILGGAGQEGGNLGNRRVDGQGGVNPHHKEPQHGRGYHGMGRGRGSAAPFCHVVCGPLELNPKP